MEALFWTAAIVVILFAGISLYASRTKQQYRQVVETPYKWLSVMSLTEWKTTIKLRDDLGLRQGLLQEQIGDLPLILMYADLNQLVREALIEEKYQLKEYASGRVTVKIYRLTPKGLQKAREKASEAQEGIRGAEPQPV